MAPRRSHRWLLGGAAVGTVTAVALLLARVPLGVPGEWPLRYVEDTSPAVLIEPLVLGLLLAGVAWFGVGQAERAVGRRLALAVLVVLGFLFALSVGAAGPFGVAEPAYRARYNAGIGSYLAEAEHIGPFPDGRTPEGGAAAPGPAAYLTDFHRRVAEQPLDATAFRVAVHPPGMTLLVYAVNRTWRSSPARREAAARALSRLGWAGLGEFLFPGRSTSARRLAEKLTGLSMFGLGALVVALTALTVYALTLDLGGDRRTAIGAAALWLVVPSTLLHAPALDQVTPLLALGMALCWHRACARRSRLLAVLAGAMLWAGLFFTLAMAVVAFALAVATVLAVWGRPGWRRHWPLAAWAAGAVAIASVLTWLVLDYNVVLVLYQCARRNAEWNATIGARSYGAWLAWNPVLFALFLGPAATALWLHGTTVSLVRQSGENVGQPPSASGEPPHRSGSPPSRPGFRSPSAAWVPAVALAATMLLLWLSGQNRGEVERLWSVLMALALVVGAAALARTRPLGRSVWLALILLQLAVVFTLRYRGDIQNVRANLAEQLVATAGRGRTGRPVR